MNNKCAGAGYFFYNVILVTMLNIYCMSNNYRLESHSDQSHIFVKTNMLRRLFLIHSFFMKLSLSLIYIHFEITL